MKGKQILSIVLTLGLILTLAAGLSVAQEPVPEASAASEPSEQLGTAFTYQGRLSDGDLLVNESCDLRFKLYDAATGGTQIGGTQTETGVELSDGLFTVHLDFGAQAFTGDARWLEVKVRCPAGAGSYTTLLPRQAVTPVPYALYVTALSGGEYWSVLGNAGTTPGVNFVGTTDAVSLTLAVNGRAALRLEPAADEDYGFSPNVIGGWSGNSVEAGVVGATIGGGGATQGCEGGAACSNAVTGDLGTVCGGGNNSAGARAFVGGGIENRAGGSAATILGGVGNAATGRYSTVAGGGVAESADPWQGNRAWDDFCTIGGGATNMAGFPDSDTEHAMYATVAGGQLNKATAESATIGGGEENDAWGGWTTVGGGYNNTADRDYATIGGGRDNYAGGQCGSVGGGWANMADAAYATIAGGRINEAHAAYATIAGGGPSDLDNAYATRNRVTDDYGTIGGGGGNQAGDGAGTKTNARYATVGGGDENTASGRGSTVGGGAGNTASGTIATVGGGWHNTASGQDSTVAGGTRNTAGAPGSTVGGGGDNTAWGWHAVVPGGGHNEADGNYSFASGRRAKAEKDGCFVWGDSQDIDVTCDVQNRWTARASGGVYFYTNKNLTSGMYLAAGGSAWNAVSARERKENHAAVDAQELLARLAEMPITTWNYKSQDPTIRHIGPMAGDLNSLVEGLGGEGEGHINSLDIDGVALAAIQGLYVQNQALQAENAGQQAQIDDLEARLAALEALLAALAESGKGGQP